MSDYELVVIGGGPGGYVAAIRAAQLGMKVACVDDNASAGGTCLRIGCIPSKALLESSERFISATAHGEEHGIIGTVGLDLGRMMKRKDKVVKTLTGGVNSLLKKNGVAHLKGRGSLLAANRVRVATADENTEITADRVLVATGSVPASLPGLELDGDRIGSSTEALAYDEVPKHLVVIGAGYIGLELGSVWNRLGSKVTVLEYLDRILPGMDGEIAAAAHQVFSRQGLEFRLGAKVTGVRTEGDSCRVEVDDQEPLECDRVLVAVGRQPASDGLGLADLGVKIDDRGFIEVDAHYKTSVDGVFAIGDVIGGAMLAHKAEEEGIACVEQLAGIPGHVNYDAIPGVVYTDPEIASVGKTEEELVAEGVEFRKGSFPFRGNGRARAVGSVEGHAKILAHAETDRLLGVHIIGPHAGDLIAEAVAAIEFGASAEDLARTSHAHPTLAEVLKEAALAVDERAIHI